jgi:hypothetical protein
MSWWLLLAVVVITVGSRIVALAVLPPPRGVVAEIVRRMPAPLFAALAALSIANGGPTNPAILAAAGCALLAALRWPSLLTTLAAGLAGFLVASLIW